MNLSEILKKEYGKDLKDCTNQEIYAGLLDMVQKKAKEREVKTGKKKLYYISAEFLIGKLLIDITSLIIGFFSSILYNSTDSFTSQKHLFRKRKNDRFFNIAG